MRILHERAIGLDIHSRMIAGCLDYPDPEAPDGRAREHRRFETFTDALAQLCNWVSGTGASVVAMESTGQYWRPLWWLLGDRCPTVQRILANPHHIKQVPGRKSDTTDAEWLAELAAYGLVRASLVPSAQIYQLRDLTRHRHRMIHQRGSEVQRVLSLVESAGIKFGIVASDIMGVSVRRMLDALVAGERDVSVLADMALTRLRGKIPQLQRAAVGSFTQSHADRLAVILDFIDYLDGLIERLNTQIAPLMTPFAEKVAHLMTVPGFGPRVIETLIAQTTGDMSYFRDEHHLASWACMSPGNYESAGKRKSGRTRKGNPELRSALVEAAWAASRTNTYHGGLYRHLVRTLGNNPVGRKKAIVAVGHSLLCTSWWIMKHNVDYHDLGADYFKRHYDPAKEATRLIKRLRKITGKDVILQPAA